MTADTAASWRYSVNMRKAPSPSRKLCTLAVACVLGAFTLPLAAEPQHSMSLTYPFGSIGPLGSGGPPYPPSVDWKQMRTSSHRLIFPEGDEETARRAARAAETAHRKVEADLNVEVAPYPVIINTSTRMANGYFALAPRRSEWYGYNSQLQFAGPVDWFHLLALHEGRHAAQMTALDRGFTRIARWLAGEYGWSFLAMYSMPLWFFEGDAIMAETLYSSAGRGRSAAFHREIRAILEEEREISYSQAYLGSYRRHFPNHYYLGFPLVAYIRITYGQEAWNEIIRRTSRFSFWPLRFHIVVKQVTGRSVSQIYEDAMGYFEGYFARLEERGEGVQETEESDGRTEGTTAAVRRFEDLPASGWTNYLPVGAGEEGGFYALRYGDRWSDALVEVKKGEAGGIEVRRLRRVAAMDRHVSVSSGRAVWTEHMPHALWMKVSSRDIFVYDLDERRRRRLTHGGAYQAPALSPDGSRIAAVYALPGGGAELRILSAESGKTISAFGQKDASFILQPAWSPDGRRVAAVAVGGGLSSLMEWNVSEEERRIVLGPVEEDLSEPAYAGDYLLYVSGRYGKEEIEAVELEGGARFLLASGEGGAVAPLPTDRGIFFADYSGDGFRPALIALNAGGLKAVLEPLPARGGGSVDYVRYVERAPTEKSEGGHTDPVTDRAPEPEVEEYRAASHLLNVHSWGVLPTDDGRAQAFVQSDDVLGTLSLQAYTGINPRRRAFDAGVQGLYRGIFPMIRFGVSGDTHYPADPDRRRNGANGFFGVEAPFDLSGGMWYRRLSLSSTLFSRYEQGRPDVAGDRGRQVLPLRHRASLYNASKAVSAVDFASPWEQYLELMWMHMPFPLDDEGSRFFSQGHLTVPGPWRHHRIRAAARGEWKYGEDVPLVYPIVRPRGYDYDWSEDYERELIAGLEYALPLLYPDLALGQFYYLKRIRLNLFTEVGFTYPRTIGPTDIPSYLESWEEKTGAGLHPASGAELLFEQHLFSWPISFEAGLRFIYRWRDEVYRLEETVFTLGFEW